MASTPDRNDDRLPVVRSRAQVVQEGRLPLTELTFDRAGAASPFGDDLVFPLPISELTYVHPHPDAAPQHL
jgi:succinate dehydrogenase / fumarate reductase iron-sulfur subunit